MPKRVLQGVVVSNKANKTVVVSVSRRVMHPVYKKTIVRSKKYAAHDEQNSFKEGDNVKIIECAPRSKTKRWEVIYEGAEAATATAAPKKKAASGAAKPKAKKASE